MLKQINAGRFVGPYSETESVDYTEMLLNNSELRHVFEQFLSGEIEAREMSYSIQLIVEEIEAEQSEAIKETGKLEPYR